MLYLEVKIKYNYACTDFFFQSADHRDIMNLVNAYEHFLGKYIIHATFI